MLGMDSPHQATIETVLEMRRLFQEQVGRVEIGFNECILFHQVAIASAAEAMSTGQMLLCAANTLFDKVPLLFTSLMLETFL